MWISLTINLHNILIGTAYRPPWLDVDKFFDTLTESILFFTKFDEIILLGDFNINLLNNTSNSSQQLNNFLRYTNLQNYVTEPTHFTSHSETLIDIVCSNIPIINLKINHNPDLGGHAMILAEVKIKKPKIPSKRITYRPIKNINMIEFNKDLERVNWNGIINENSVDSMVTSFNKAIMDIFDKHAPVKTFITKDHYSPWLTSNVRYIMKLRDEAHAKYKTRKTDVSKSEYKDLKHLSNISAICEKKAFYDHHINAHLKNSTYLWKNLKKHVLPNFKNTGDLPEQFDNPDVINDHFLNIPGNDAIDESCLARFGSQKFLNNSSFQIEPVHENSAMWKIPSFQETI
ncbi:uncharacterized protein LOC123875750 [Maniola jurtina]|uniref:uncharacterized protein LOC123875750 n=1 Tax=Maniola jurtina TaxID=191418 RepID=UPI001E688868|nr:uncharacterized protein LOC123875750 [Maniola jurtina]